MSESQIFVFLLTSVLVILSPGQDMVLVMSRGMTQGAKAGIATAAGVSMGLLGHTVLVTIGLGAIMQSSELAFTAMKYVGAMYLVYLGIKALQSPPVQLDKSVETADKLWKSFRQGTVSNLSNPKVAIFYFAYLPQFITPGNIYATESLLVLGLAFALITFMVKVPIGYAAGALSGWFQDHPVAQTWINRTSGSVLIGFGIRLAEVSRSEGL